MGEVGDRLLHRTFLFDGSSREPVELTLRDYGEYVIDERYDLKVSRPDGHSKLLCSSSSRSYMISRYHETAGLIERGEDLFDTT